MAVNITKALSGCEGLMNNLMAVENGDKKLTSSSHFQHSVILYTSLANKCSFLQFEITDNKFSINDIEVHYFGLD
jgi:hypothetical protein